MENVDWQINKSSSECNRYILENELDCDISFKVGKDQEVIKAHKFILKTRSPVYDRMFIGGFQEAETDPVVPDVSPAAFRALLRYCYYEFLDIEGEVALSLLYAATKYMLPILEEAARKTLIQKLNPSKIWDVCKYSTQVGDDELHKGCIEYLKGHLSSENLLQVIEYPNVARETELNDYCRKYFMENLSEANILEVTKYIVSIGDEELHTSCRNYMKEHLMGSNVWEVYKFALDEGDLEVLQSCREYFESDVTMVREALQSKEFTDMQYELLLDVMHINDKVNNIAGNGFNPGISISEIELFTACNTWAEAECLRQKFEPTGRNRRTVLGECLSLIRFPTMLQKDLATAVYPTGILTNVEMVKLGEYIYRNPGSECQVDFPCKERQFLLEPPQAPVKNEFSIVYVEPEVRVKLCRLWLWYTGSYIVTVRDEKCKKLWSVELDAKHDNHLSAQGKQKQIIHYFDLEPPKVLDAGTKYTITAESQSTTHMEKKLGEKYVLLKGKHNPYKELKVLRDTTHNDIIHSLTMSLV